MPWPTRQPLALILSLFVLLLTACNPSESSSDDDDNGNGDNGSENGNGDDNGNGDGDLVELDYGLGFVMVMEPEPDQIALRRYGTYLIPETTRLSFQVLDNDLNPVSGHDISFEITDTTGDPELTWDEHTTNADGVASTILRSGTVQGTTQVEVRMDLLDSSGDLVESDVHVATTLPISMHTAAPVTDGMGLSADRYNPETCNTNGEPVEITVHLADMHNNPVADGTLVNFLASEGIVDPTCTAENGECTIEWRSNNTCGRVDVLARTNGNDAFIDQNGNSLFDDGEPYTPQGEPFVDADGSGDFTPGDFFWDLSGTGDYTPVDSEANYKGVGCTEEAINQGHCADRAVVFGNISFSGSTSMVSIDPAPQDTTTGETETYQLVDQNGNIPPEGTELTVECSGDASAEVNEGEVPGTGIDPFGPWDAEVTYGAEAGACTLEVQSPNGNTPARYTIDIS